MKKRYMFLAAVIIVAVLLIYIAYKKQATPGEYDDFAKCLTKNNATMYGTKWCTHCKVQKTLFGKSFKYINYIDCDGDGAACVLNGIKGYPTWIIGNESYPGTQSLETLARLSKCELNGEI